MNKWFGRSLSCAVIALFFGLVLAWMAGGFPSMLILTKVLCTIGGIVLGASAIIMAIMGFFEWLEG